MPYRYRRLTHKGLNMNSNQEQIERVANLLKQAGSVLETIDLRPRPSPAEMFMRTLVANLDNDKLSDADFRQLVRNSLPEIVFPEDRHVVMTNRGEAYRLNGLWFAWHGNCGSKVAMKDQEAITTWRYVEGLPRA